MSTIMYNYTEYQSNKYKIHILCISINNVPTKVLLHEVIIYTFFNYYYSTGQTPLK